MESTSVKNTAVDQEATGQGVHPHPPHREVRITVNGQVFTVPAEIYPVPRLKAMTGVPQEDNLEQVIDGKVVPLDDHGKVTIHGGEEFVSFTRPGGSS